MNAMTISLPDPVKEFVEDLVAQGEYGSPDEYVEALIRDDRRRREREHLEALLREGINSGPATELTAKDWEHIHQEVERRAAERRSRIDGQATSEGR
jgi:antitoxin ParD1/3/4